MRWSLFAVVLIVGCDARPDRPDPFDYPGIVAETGLGPIPNNCLTQTHTFSMSVSGYRQAQLEGVGTYVYQSSPDGVTQVLLTACDGDEPAGPVVTLNYFGATRLDAGVWNVRRTARQEGGFTFTYADPGFQPDTGFPTTVQCNWDPTGTVEVTQADFGEVGGSFTLTASCRDEPLLGRKPKKATFRGTFRANNAGSE